MEKYQQLLEYWENLNDPFTVENIPIIPHVEEKDYKNIIIPAIIRCGGIPKDQLIIGKTYIGDCRNASEAMWDGKQFEYTRYKWGSSFKENINHFEDDDGYDLFIPLKKK